MEPQKVSDPLAILAETARYRLGHFEEDAYLVEKATGLGWHVGDHYGNPTGGVIGTDERWCVVGGEGLTYFDFEGSLRSFWRRGDPGGEPRFVHALRLESPSEVRILLDPWCEYHGTWVLDCRDFSFRKLSDGPDLREEPWRDEVEF